MPRRAPTADPPTRGARLLRLGVLGLIVAVAVVGAERESEACQVVEVHLVPSGDLQLVVWVEDEAGNFVDTLFVTRMTGTYGLGNRPGIMEFNSEFLWPYGRRTGVFPVWANRHGVRYPLVIFQDELDRDLSHEFAKSSVESYYCRPFKQGEDALQRSIDTGTCATIAYTDKGKFAPDRWSPYPPRADLTRDPMRDHADVLRFGDVNDLDAVSRATPPPGMPFVVRWAVPASVPPGRYVVWVEAAKEFDANDTHAYPGPNPPVAYGDYGRLYRGQPSILWRVPIDIDEVERVALTAAWAGYGDPYGLDGDVRPPDASITTGVEGSGAGRLLLGSSPEGTYQVRVVSRPGNDEVSPAGPTDVQVVDAGPTEVVLDFVEPGDDGAEGGAVLGYDVRLFVGRPMTAANFPEGVPVSVTPLRPSGPGQRQAVTVTGLQPETRYWIGIAAHDDCLNAGPPTIVEAVTPRAPGGEVSACFVATAAWGSPMAADVQLLRGVRDRLLRRTIPGELLVETYYTFGPPVAALIRPSATLRRLARAALAPVVERARALGR